MPEVLEDIELRSEEVQEILTRVPRWMIRWGSTLFLALIIMVLAITWFVKYPDIIGSEAMLTTEIPPQKEFAQITAKIDSIFVEESQHVSENSILAVLDNTANTQDVFYLKSILDTISIKNRTIEFPLDELPILFLGDIDIAYANFENSYAAYILNRDLQPFSNDALANKISISESKGRLESLRAQYALSESELEFKKNELKRSKSLFDKGVISKQEYENKQLEILTAERNLKSMGVSISNMREAISNARKTATGTEITRTREEIQLLKSTFQAFNQLKKAIRDWENTYVLKSEIEGTVSFLGYWNKNQTVNAGDQIFTIIPSQNSNYIAKLKTPSQNSGKIKLGQEVNVKLQNFPETEFGVLKGKVTYISLTPDKEGFYLVDVALPEELITSYNKEIVFKQEMAGTAEIITEDLRLLERFFYQFKDILSR